MTRKPAGKNLRLIPLLLASMPCMLATVAAHAADAASDNALMVMVMGTSDYRMRGISQTRLEPALQASVDFTNRANGLYVGSMVSNIKWIDDMGGNDKLDWEVYGGKRGKFTPDIAYDVGIISFVYPGNGMMPNDNTTEMYAQIGVGAAYLKYSDSVSNLFGYMDSRNSGYLDVGANFIVASGVTLNLHAGHQTVKNNDASSYSDWKVGITDDFSFASVSVAAIGTNTTSFTGPAPEMKNLGKTGAVLTVTKMF